MNASQKWMSNPENRKKHQEWVKRYKVKLAFRVKEYARINKLREEGGITAIQHSKMIMTVE